MSGAPHDADEAAAWPRYARALAALHGARDDASRELREQHHRELARAEGLAAADARLESQRQALTELAVRLRHPLPPAALEAATVPGPEPATGADVDLSARLDVTDAALAEARRVAGLPQLLPAWSNRFARAAVVYAVLCVPSLLLTLLLSLAGVRGSRTALVWFAVVWPAIVALVGRAVVLRVSRPRDDLPARSGAPDPPARPGDSPVERRLAERVDGLLRPAATAPAYPWLGVLLAWASWLVPGLLLDWLGGLWPG